MKKVPEAIHDIRLPAEFDGLDVVVVGGYVRDFYLGKNTEDVDLMVTGVSPEELEKRGFRKKKSNGPQLVFIDSMNRDVTLPRTSKNQDCVDDVNDERIIDPEISHEEAVRQDLNHRDLTINSMAIDLSSGRLFDPLDGRKDIRDEVIRHIDNSLSVDPIRVLRAARYASKYGFSITQETKDQMEITAPQLEDITPDRIGKELIKVLNQDGESRMFFDILNEVGVLEYAYPELYELSTVPAGPLDYHGEGSALEHTLQVLTEIEKRRDEDIIAMLSALGHDLGKGETDEEILPHHYGHEKKGFDVARNMENRLALNSEYKGSMATSAKLHGYLGKIDELNASTIIDVAEGIEKSPLSLEQFIDLGVADKKGRIPEQNLDVQTIRNKLEPAIEIVKNTSGLDSINKRGYDKDDVGSEIPHKEISNLVKQDRTEMLRKMLD